MAKSDEEARIAVSLPQAVRDDLTDVAFILRIPEKDLVAKAIIATLESIKNSKGETFKKALEIVKAAREDA
jgi:hypothetical protein